MICYCRINEKYGFCFGPNELVLGEVLFMILYQIRFSEGGGKQVLWKSTTYIYKIQRLWIGGAFCQKNFLHKKSLLQLDISITETIKKKWEPNFFCFCQKK